MKAKDLIKRLQRLDGELVVVLSSDPEGNSYYTLDKDMDITEETVAFYPLEFIE